MKREQWLEERRTGIGGSDVAGILGVSKWSSPMDVYLSKIGQADELAESPAMRWGTLLEAAIRDEFARVMGVEVQQCGMIRSELHPFMIANVDGLVGDSEILECKTARSADGWGEAGTNEIPVYYITQVMHYLAVTGRELAHVAVLIAGSDFRTYVVERDEAFIEDLIEAERAFWFDHVIPRIPPDPVNAEDAKKIWPQDCGMSLEVDEPVKVKVSLLKEAKLDLKAAEERVAFFEDEIRLAFGEYAALTWHGDVIATYKSQSSNRIDTTALKSEMPDVAAKYTKQSSTRVLRIK